MATLPPTEVSMIAPHGIWGRLMAIRQTLAWAGLHPNDTSCLEYAEPTCLRLVEQARAIAGENAEMLAVLDQVEALLRTLVEQAPEDRMDLLEALFDTLELVVPAEFADPKQRPRRGRGRGGRRDRGRRKSRLIDPSEHDRGEEPEASVDAEAEHDAVANSSSPEDIVETPAS